jgi:hypothetical protein
VKGARRKRARGDFMGEKGDTAALGYHVFSSADGFFQRNPVEPMGT